MHTLATEAFSLEAFIRSDECVFHRDDLSPFFCSTSILYVLQNSELFVLPANMVSYEMFQRIEDSNVSLILKLF